MGVELVDPARAKRRLKTRVERFRKRCVLRRLRWQPSNRRDVRVVVELLPNFVFVEPPRERRLKGLIFVAVQRGQREHAEAWYRRTSGRSRGERRINRGRQSGRAEWSG